MDTSLLVSLMSLEIEFSKQLDRLRSLSSVTLDISVKEYIELSIRYRIHELHEINRRIVLIVNK